MTTATASLAGRVPMRWPREWTSPESLSLLAGTPVNCLLPDHDASPALIEKARAADIATAMLEPGELTPAAWTGPGEVLLIRGGVWPRVKGSKAGGDTVEAGPTGLPWVDCNGWMGEVGRACAPNKTLWLQYAFPADAGLAPRNAYAIALADAEAFRARWVIELDPELQRGIAKRSDAAMREWQAMMEALRFFQAHREWRSWGRKGTLAVLSDFTGPNENFSAELLNLLARRGSPMLALDRRNPAAVRWDRLHAVFYADQQPPEPALRTALEAFVRKGGLVMAGSTFPHPGTKPEPAEPWSAYDVYRMGKGRIALSREELIDPWLAAGEAQLLTSRRNDQIRFWNAGATNFTYTASPDGSRDLIQIVCYANVPRQTPVTAGVRGRLRHARIWRFGGQPPQTLELRSAPGGWTEIDLPDLNIYAAVELER